MRYIIQSEKTRVMPRGSIFFTGIAETYDDIFDFIAADFKRTTFVFIARFKKHYFIFSSLIHKQDRNRLFFIYAFDSIRKHFRRR